MTVVSVLVIAALLLLLNSCALAAESSPLRKSGSLFLDPVHLDLLTATGIWTLVAAFYAVILGLVLGIALGMGRLSNRRPIRWACGSS